MKNQPILMKYGIPEPVVLPPGFPNTVQTEPNGGITMEGVLDRFSKVLDRIEQEVSKVASEVSNLSHRIENLEKKTEVPEIIQPKVCPSCEDQPIYGIDDEGDHWYECYGCGLRGPSRVSKTAAAIVWNKMVFNDE